MMLVKLDMTPKERLTAYARGEEVDRIPTALSAAETIPLLYGINLCDHYFSADLMVQTETALAQDFGADNMGIGLGLRSLPEALGVKLAYPKDSVSYIVEPAIASFDEIDRITPANIDRDGRLPIIVEAFERLQEKFGGTRILSSGLAGPLTTAASLIGTEKFLKAMIREKEDAHRLLQRATDCVVKCCEDMHRRLGIKFTLSEPMASRNLLSGKHAAEFFFPYLKQAVERMNIFQGSTGIHICGSTRDRWQEVVDCGVSGFWIDNCESMRELKGLYGDKIAISGNVTPVEVLKNGTPEAVAEAVRQCVLDAADNPCGYTLCPGCTTPVLTPRENLIAFMNAAATYGRGARKGCVPEGVRGN
ncbi:MAG: uroporphyrinogen decarboxylase family protein [Fretibacterium sp.]|nr:uroporphyrinogen decarboxylase family protein [Fretibacterium sp.]